MPGPVPKLTHQRERDTKRRQNGSTALVDDGQLRGPEFPYDIIEHPHPATVEWWETWRRSPQASIFQPTDWQTLKRAVRLQEDTMTAPRASAAAISELRLIEERLGATVVDRLRAKLTIVQPSPVEALAPVTPIGAGGLADRMRRPAAPADAPGEDTPPF
ncbi:terminase small subunit [Microbacterium phage Gretchen]|nr:terminase small subunit [Microbacterium phage Gretchen]